MTSKLAKRAGYRRRRKPRRRCYHIKCQSIELMELLRCGGGDIFSERKVGVGIGNLLELTGAGPDGRVLKQRFEISEVSLAPGSLKLWRIRLRIAN